MFIQVCITFDILQCFQEMGIPVFFWTDAIAFLEGSVKCTAAIKTGVEPNLSDRVACVSEKIFCMVNAAPVKV